MEALPIKLLYNPLTRRFYCPQVERYVLPKDFAGVYEKVFILQSNHTDGTVCAITSSIKHELEKVVAIWKVKPKEVKLVQQVAALSFDFSIN